VTAYGLGKRAAQRTVPDKLSAHHYAGCPSENVHVESCPFYPSDEIERAYRESDEALRLLREKLSVQVFTRPDWDEYFLGIVKAVAVRGDCRRRKIGAILVNKDHRHRGSGYNGSRPGGPSCLLGECPRGLKSKEEIPPNSPYRGGPFPCHSLHAEKNLLLDTRPEDRVESTIYISDGPCDDCLLDLQGCGAIRIVWPAGSWYLDHFQNKWLQEG
jgi:dCMP deaminase